MTTTERETEIVTGVVGGITQKGEQWIIEVTPEGSQYPKKCRTKSDDTQKLAATLYGQTATFECGVSHWQYEGKPVSSLWVNAINPGTPPPQEPPGAAEAVQAVAQEATGSPETVTTNLDGAQPPIATPSAQQPAERSNFGDPKQASIERQQALICAVSHHAGTAATVEQVLATAAAFDSFLARVVPFRPTNV